MTYWQLLNFETFPPLVPGYRLLLTHQSIISVKAINGPYFSLPRQTKHSTLKKRQKGAEYWEIKNLRSWPYRIGSAAPRETVEVGFPQNLKHVHHHHHHRHHHHHHHYCAHNLKHSHHFCHHHYDQSVKQVNTNTILLQFTTLVKMSVTELHFTNIYNFSFFLLFLHNFLKLTIYNLS